MNAFDGHASSSIDSPRKRLLIIAMAPVGEPLSVYKKRGGLSGGDRILIELLKKWQVLFSTSILTWEGGEYIIRHLYGINDSRFLELNVALGQKLGDVALYAHKIVAGVFAGLFKPFDAPDLIYSSSDFLPDILPAFLLKCRHSQSRWIAAFFLFCPSPFSPDFPYRGRNYYKGLVYYVSQFFCKHLIKRFADVVFVTSEPDVAFFVTKRRPRERVLVIQGGVDVETSLKVGPQPLVYDALFIGRFHPQKGVLELIDIWSEFVRMKKDARLAIIGYGYLEGEMKALAEKRGVLASLTFFGFLDGVEKIRVMKSAKMVLHPATYDSGGMAACEAFACGLPGVSFDLPALRTYYPRGMLKTPCFDKTAFAKNMYALLTDTDLFERMKSDAIDLSHTVWDWRVRSHRITEVLLPLLESRSGDIPT